MRDYELHDMVRLLCTICADDVRWHRGEQGVVVQIVESPTGDVVTVEFGLRRGRRSRIRVSANVLQKANPLSALGRAAVRWGLPEAWDVR